MKRFIHELVNLDSMNEKAALQYTVIELEKEDAATGKVIFTLCDNVAVGDIFLTNDKLTPLWSKNEINHTFKLISLKEYLQSSMKENTVEGSCFINRVVNARHRFTSVIAKL